MGEGAATEEVATRRTDMAEGTLAVMKAEGRAGTETGPHAPDRDRTHVAGVRTTHALHSIHILSQIQHSSLLFWNLLSSFHT